MRALCVRSRTTNPFLNLAYENWLFNERRDFDVILFLWKNDPCIVIGRNQIPWLECDVAQCQDLNIPIIRRFSGGGAVFHDHGNSLFSFMSPREHFSRSRFGSLISNHFKTRLNIPIETNHRHDLTLHGSKVSGSAFRITRDRAYHHGTLLHGSDLGRLSSLLRSPIRDSVKGATVSSVVSPVINVPGLDHELFCSHLTDIIRENFKLEGVEDFTGSQDIKEDVGLLQSWAWTFGKGPEFQIQDLTIRHGLIQPRGVPFTLDRIKDVFM